MKVALIGYGKMGKMIDSIAADHDVDIVGRVDPKRSGVAWEKEAVDQADVCIDFSHPDAVMQSLEQASKWNKPLVIGTTGWYDRIDQIKGVAEKNDLGVVFGQNFSLGMNLFLNVVTEAAKMIDPFAQYDVAITETHHREKVDAPSGTAYAIADRLLQHLQRKTKVCLEGKAEPDALHIGSSRVGRVPGTHSVIFDSEQDTITLSHQAHSRKAWAFGALQAAKWIQNKKGFYHLTDMMEDLLCSNQD